LYDWKGAQILAESSKQIEDCKLIFVGGTINNVKEFKLKNKEFKNISILGHQPFKKIPKYLKSADVLILPNSAQDKQANWTSPIKLFQYMVSKKPIIASDLPSIREVLNESNAIFFKPDDPKDLAEKIKYILNNPEKAKSISAQARIDVQNYTWDKRAESIINFIK
jgi:glycosyltransferase involved in cell wall biosynthesis